MNRKVLAVGFLVLLLVYILAEDKIEQKQYHTTEQQMPPLSQFFTPITASGTIASTASLPAQLIKMQ